MRLSVIFTTYNATQWLEKVLWGYHFQTFKDFEIIIADDGSTQETAQLIEKIRNETQLNITHVWHEDNGFQKCRILNKAILHARTDYIVFSDGDCIPRYDFLQQHHDHAEKDCYLSGSYYKLPMSTSETIQYNDIKTGQCFDVNWLHKNGLSLRRKTLKLRAGKTLAPILNKTTFTSCNLKGSNASVWLKDILAVNGFDERMQWGGLDREFGVRLINYNIRPKHVRYNAICIHLDHPRGYKDPHMVATNKKLRQKNAKDKVSWTEHGIQQLLDEGYMPEHNVVIKQLPPNKN